MLCPTFHSRFVPKAEVPGNAVQAARTAPKTPTNSQPVARNFSIAATPKRPLAPVTSAFFGGILF